MHPRRKAGSRPVSERAWRTAPWCCALMTLTLLAGCGSKPRLPGTKKDERPPAVLLEVQAPGPLAELLRENLDLARLPAMTQEPLREGEIDRLVAAAPAQARSLVRTEGYFNAEIAVENLGGDPPRVRVTVQPGPRAIVGDVQLDVQGPLREHAERGEPNALEAQQALRREWPLPPGAPFVDETWSRAKTQSLARLRAQGYVGADWKQTQARVDAATNRVTLTGRIDSGPLYRTGPLRIQGLNHHDERTVRNIANFPPGKPATEELLLDFQERLQASSLFDRATVSLDNDPQDPSDTPVRVRLGERKLQEATFGVGFGANVGPRATVEHTHRRPFGRPWLMRNQLEVAAVRQIWVGELSTHTLPGLYRNLAGGAAERVESETDVVKAVRARVGRAHDSKRITRLLYAQAESSLTTSDVSHDRSDAVGAYFEGIWRDVDDVLLPTTGQVWDGEVGAGVARSDPGTHGPFGRLHGRLLVYRPFGSWFAQGRVELGQVYSRDDVVVPETLRFRAGGDESVRGYGYRDLAPVVNGVTVSGRVIFTASAEIARPILQKLPDLWGAAFVDVGRAAMRWSELDPALGLGVGLRYRSPVGPVKLDVAWGEEVNRLRLHFTVGVGL
jgi:translocation and assembly module TamA